jgi:hypothetical protein
MIAANNSLEGITEIELESIFNYAIKECFETVLDEAEYFFENKEHLVDIFIEGIDFSKLTPRYLQDRFYKVFYSGKEIENFLGRIEKRIQRELVRASIDIDISLQDKNMMDLFNVEDSFLFVCESSRTYALSCNTCKAVNTLWKKSSKSFMPKALLKISMGVNVGEYFLSSMGVTPDEIKRGISGQVSKSVRGILKNKKLDLINSLKKEIVAQIIKSESMSQAILSDREIVRREITKTA